METYLSHKEGLQALLTPAGEPMNSTELTERVQSLLQVDAYAFIALMIGLDEENPDKQSIALTDPPLGLGSKIATRQTTLLKSYTETIT